jgi:hypothetical protein
MRHLAPRDERERRVRREPEHSSTHRPATASSAVVAGVGSASPVFWSQVDVSQSTASAPGVAPPMTNPKYRPEPIAVRPGSIARARCSTTSTGSEDVAGSGSSSTSSISRYDRSGRIGRLSSVSR